MEVEPLGVSSVLTSLLHGITALHAGAYDDDPLNIIHMVKRILDTQIARNDLNYEGVQPHL